MRKLRVMVCGEASFLSTGFSTYSLEILKRFHASGKYDLMEYASYGPFGDARAEGLPWHYKTAMPNPENKSEVDGYENNPLNQFGDWKFEEACLEFLPDVVCDARDHWMLEYQERSPFRPFYRWAVMPTCDSEPQEPHWIATYANADAVFTYSDWALDILSTQSNGKIALRGSASPGADFDTYEVKPDRPAHKNAMGLDRNCLIVGTVMRNQRRKLYPELMEGFARFLKEAPAELARRAYLYLHTSWPDVGWNIPRLLLENGIASRTLFTYHCKTCNASFPSFFQDSKCICRNCGSPSATLPASNHGISRKALSDVMNVFDVYVQYANSEGFGMPMVEAAACGLPVMATDFSAMSDVVRKVKGYPIKVLFLQREVETHCKRAIPDPADFVRQLTEILSLPEPVRRKKGFAARRAAERHYTWDAAAAQWMRYFDSIEVRDESPWTAVPARMHQPETHIPEGLSNEELVRWGMVHVAGRPDLVNSYTALRLIRDLNWGATLGYGQGSLYFNDLSALGEKERYSEFTRNHALNMMASIADKQNVWEQRRITLAGKGH